METLLLADWVEVVFLHFRVAPTRVQPLVPLELDLFDGDAYVSLVAFTQRRLRPARGGRLAAVLAAPLATHEFFNVRTYVRAGADRGIYFLAEWIPNRLAVLIGPRAYGLPYRLGRLEYQNESWRPNKCGWIKSGSRTFSYRASPSSAPSCALDEFLLERYTAFTHRNGATRRFAVSHAPWPHARIDAEIENEDLLDSTGDWFEHAELVCADYSPGVLDVGIGAPAACATRLQ